MIMTQHPTRVLTMPTLVPHTAQRRAGAFRPDRANAELARFLSSCEPIDLDQMDGVALQDRIDTKYVFHAGLIQRTLAALAEHYRVLEIDGNRIHRYQTLYFDTADFTLYHQHHAGGSNRYKVRSRSYLDTGLSCLEIKLKAHGDRTIKQRLRTPEPVTALTPQAGAFLREHLPPTIAGLQPQLWNTFSRITLVGKRQPERVTLDLDLHFSGNGDTVVLPGAVVAEVKQGRHGRTSPFMRLMREAGIRSTGFSKYCIGVSLLFPEIKHNNFKPHQRLLRKLVNGDSL
ncbi:MAG TPA: polyphosphate polymerase domain-containing protein [Herpetosiphonaceae bacterium]